MKVTPTGLPDVLLVEPRVFEDARGVFLEMWHAVRYAAEVTPLAFVQDNVSVSRRGVVRGLHFQHPHDQGKLISVLAGAVYDVAVDIRPGSPTFGRWVAQELSDRNRRQLWIPPGFAHGLQALTDGVVVHYKCTEVYVPDADRAILWSDPALGIEWPIAGAIISPKDAVAPLLHQLAPEQLPAFA